MSIFGCQNIDSIHELHPWTPQTELSIPSLDSQLHFNMLMLVAIQPLAIETQSWIQKRRSGKVLWWKAWFLYIYYYGLWVWNATKDFAPGEFLLQYPGDLIIEKEADVRGQDYTRDSKGYFMYFFSVRKNAKHVDLAVNLKSTFLWWCSYFYAYWPFLK